MSANSADHATHATHDPLLIAALADREVAGEDAAAARELVASCADCAALHQDLVALTSATRVLPTPARPRDFRLRPADAERLRPNLIRRILGVLGTPRDTLSRPLALGLTTIGLAGLLVGTVPAVIPVGGPATEVLQTVGQGTDIQGDNYAITAAPEDAPAGAEAPGGGAPAASAAAAPAPAGGEVGQIDDDGAERAADEASDPSVALAPDPSGISGLIVVSGSLLIAGLGLLALRWTSRRFGG